MHFPQAVFGFEATFVGDQKEQDVLSTAVDLHHARQVRHLEALLDRSRLAEGPWEPLPEAPHGGLASAYPVARDRVIRTVSALANARARELNERLARQLGRMARYYADLRAEVAEQATKARVRADADAARFAARLEGLDREEHVRGAELRQKSALRVQLRLITLLVVRQPKLLAPVDDPGPGRGDRRPDRPGLGPARRGLGGRPLPEVRPPDAGPIRRPPGRPDLPGLRRPDGRGRSPRLIPRSAGAAQ